MLTIQEVFKAYHPKPVRDQYRMQCIFRENHDASNDGGKSFFVSPDINAYHCFSCNAKGNLLSLLTTRFELSFSDALELVSLDNFDRILNDDKRVAESIDMIIPMTAPTAFTKRGFGERLLRQFNVGSEINDQGKEQIYIPVYDSSGTKLVAIKNRIDRNFWYVPKDFPKEQFLYNYARALRSQENESIKRCILVEGETDVYNSCKHGLWNVVAQSGGNLTEDQAKLLAAFDEIYLALDNDKAGTVYTEIAYLQLSLYGKELKVMLYDADDPGKCKKDEWLRAYDDAVPFAEYRLRMSMEMGDDYDKIIRL